MTNNQNTLSVAYFSMEIGLQGDMKTYCGGLGILAGDTLKSAADMGINIVGVSILYKKGWFKQILDTKIGQIETGDDWDFANKLKLRPERFTMEIKNTQVVVQIWEYIIKGITNHSNPVYFLDTDLPENRPEDRLLSHTLYSTDKDIWLKQEILLGVGGFLALQTLGYKDSFTTYHLNESHGVSLALALTEHYKNLKEVRSRLCFTTHTPLKGAHQVIDKQTIQEYLPAIYFSHIPHGLWESNSINFTTLAIHFSKFTNGVAKRHQEVTQEMYPEYKIDYVTNGIHVNTWANPYFKELFDKYIPNWQNNPSNLRLAGQIPSSEIQTAHENSKIELINLTNKYSTISFDPKVFTVGFARRAVPYKRANFIFTEINKLRKIAEKYGGLQIIFAGKTGPTDDEGKRNIVQILEIAKSSDEILKVVYIPDYNIENAKKIVSGVDIWLNNPLPPLEASGTSGMKASLNGIPNFSILDGWWPEGCVENETGWAIGQNLCEGDQCRLIEINDLYDKLENVILPTFYKNTEVWQNIQKKCISLNGSYFTTHRMIMDYITKGYVN